MIELKDLKDKIKDLPVPEAQEELQNQLETYKKDVNTVTDLDELKKMEEDILKDQEEFDGYLREAEYELPQDPLDFEGRKYSVTDIAKKIVYHINRNEQEFQYCLGLHGLVTIWKKQPVEKINYGALDSTLRILGGLKYKGDSEWVDILVINNYLSSVHEPYIKDRSMMVLLAEIHNAIVDQIQKCTPLQTTETVNE